MSMTILLVEDDPVSSDLLSALLASKGCHVDAAPDGFSGLRLARENVYDIVFVDYHLPEMDGYAFARLMRSLGQTGDRALKMIAITADQYGLAARRGVDAVFDKFLAKPIDPDALYALIDAFVAERDTVAAAMSDVDMFLGEPNADDAQTASQVLWRVRGMSSLPSAAIFPAPTAAEREGLAYCFGITEPDTADCLILLNDAGLPEIAALRAHGTQFLRPVFGIGDFVSAGCDDTFQVGDPESWTRIARAIKSFQARSVLLKAEIRASAELETRLLAYLVVSESPVLIRRDPLGRTSVTRSGGFDPDQVIAAVRKLAAKGLVASRVGEAAADNGRELAIVASEQGQAAVIDQRLSRDQSIA